MFKLEEIVFVLVSGSIYNGKIEECSTISRLGSNHGNPLSKYKIVGISGSYNEQEVFRSREEASIRWLKNQSVNLEQLVLFLDNSSSGTPKKSKKSVIGSIEL